MARKKPDIVTCKVDASLIEAMRRIRNRSEFIRAAILTALDSVCPVCNGAGLLSPRQKKHFASFMADHSVKECAQCHEVHLVCGKRPARSGRSCKPGATAGKRCGT